MRRATAAALLSVALASGCGFGEGEERAGGAELRVTRDFGHEQLAADRIEPIREDQTVMRLLQSLHEVDTRFGGKFVQAIDGLAGSDTGETSWIYFVNGIEADRGAGDWEVAPGDVIQWDRRNWGAALRIPAIVGAFPEPFRSGSEGDRVPVRLECARPDASVCGDVKAVLSAAGAPVSSAQLGASAGDELLRVLVGRWDELRDMRSAASLEKGPETSGVFARVIGGGTQLELLDERGEVADTAGAGTGLVAATKPENQAITWLVTGVDDAGVDAAASGLDERTLRNAFAVAITSEGPRKLPLRADAAR